METKLLINRFFELEKEAHLLKEKKKHDVLAEYGNEFKFRKALKLKTINRAKQKDFKTLYAFYTSFFTLPEETETYKGFEATLALNTNNAHLIRYGNFEEAWIYAMLPESNEIIAGINFSLYAFDDKMKSTYGYTGSAHIIYIFVKTAYRSLGLAKYLLETVDTYANNFFGNKGEVLYICEQNAPEKMSKEEYFLDNINAQIDQCDRLVWWDKLGYKRLDFDYVQPPLNPGQDACENLTLNAKVFEKRMLPAALISYHLERFFILAVFKGNEKRIDDYYKKQMKWLSAHKEISLSGDVSYYNSLKKDFYEL